MPRDVGCSLNSRVKAEEIEEDDDDNPQLQGNHQDNSVSMIPESSNQAARLNNSEASTSGRPKANAATNANASGPKNPKGRPKKKFGAADIIREEEDDSSESVAEVDETLKPRKQAKKK